MHAVLSVPVVTAGGVAGTVKEMFAAAWRWTMDQTEAVEAYAAVIAALLRLGAAAPHRPLPPLGDEDD